MAKQATLTTITAGHTSASKINANFAALNTAFDNTLSRDGSSPNTMSVDFDMNNKDILNAGDISAVDLTIGGISVAAQATAAAASATAAAASEVNTTADAVSTGVDATATAADAVATAADLVLTDADQVSAAASASAASTSETNASSSETAAGTSETNAASSETAAASSETNAATSETNAATSETNAATSETNAAASFDQFDDRYLGDKTSDPTLDNDGNALLTGALYFNTVSDKMRVYDGAAWADIAPDGGTVTSVAVADAGSTEITVTGSPITTAGTIDLSIATIAGTKINFSGGGDLDAAVVARQAADGTLTSLAAVAGIAGDILIATGTDAWDRLAKVDDGNILTLVSGLAAWVETIVLTDTIVTPPDVLVSDTAAVALLMTGANKKTLVLDENTTITVSLEIANQIVEIEIEQGSSGGTAAWSGVDKWYGGSAPTLSTTTGQIDTIVLQSRADGSTIIAQHIGVAS